jgi:hypothetical protein
LNGKQQFRRWNCTAAGIAARGGANQGTAANKTGTIMNHRRHARQLNRFELNASAPGKPALEKP